MNDDTNDIPKRFARVLPKHGPYFVHVLSRVVDRQFILGDEEKVYFRKLMRSLAEFCGLEIVTYVIMDNHFHLLLRVPEREELTDTEIARRIRLVNGQVAAKDFLGMVEKLQKQGGKSAAAAYRNNVTRRMYDLGEFMKALKQQFTRWYNRRNDRKGTLWEARYKSVVIDGAAVTETGPSVLMTVAAYIDLNPVRANMVEDPRDYPFSGYAEAVAGHQQARKGLKQITEVMGRSTDWRMVQRAYRMLLYGAGEAKGSNEQSRPTRPGFTREQVVKVWQDQGELSTADMLRCRIRYFSDGGVLGCADFVDTLFDSHREAFGPKRSNGARKIRGLGSGEFFSLRDLKVEVIT